MDENGLAIQLAPESGHNGERGGLPVRREPLGPDDCRAGLLRDDDFYGRPVALHGRRRLAPHAAGDAARLGEVPLHQPLGAQPPSTGQLSTASSTLRPSPRPARARTRATAGAAGPMAKLVPARAASREPVTM